MVLVTLFNCMVAGVIGCPASTPLNLCYLTVKFKAVDLLFDGLLLGWELDLAM